MLTGGESSRPPSTGPIGRVRSDDLPARRKRPPRDARRFSDSIRPGGVRQQGRGSRAYRLHRSVHAVTDGKHGAGRNVAEWAADP